MKEFMKFKTNNRKGVVRKALEGRTCATVLRSSQLYAVVQVRPSNDIFKLLPFGTAPKGLIHGLLASICLISLSSCSIFASNEAPHEKTPEVYKGAFRQLPPEPVYNRLRLAYLPDIKPSSTQIATEGIQLDPEVKLNLTNSTLEQAAAALASLGNYQSYTASTVAKKKVTLKAYGTLEEVALKLEEKSGAHVVVDHSNRQIRILNKGYDFEEGIRPSFAFDDSSTQVIGAK